MLTRMYIYNISFLPLTQFTISMKSIAWSIQHIVLIKNYILYGINYAY